MYNLQGCQWPEISCGQTIQGSIDAVSEWAKELEDKGILLVPVSAVYKGRMS